MIQERNKRGSTTAGEVLMGCQIAALYLEFEELSETSWGRTVRYGAGWERLKPCLLRTGTCRSQIGGWGGC